MPPPSADGEVMGFFREMKRIAADPHPRWVFVFIFIVAVGMVLVSSLQMYVYVDFMKFSPEQKSIVHGGTMAGMGLGALVSPFLVKRFEKRGTVIVGGGLSILCNLVLASLFLTGVVPHGSFCSIGPVEVTVALVLFALFHSTYWLGNGLMMPVSNAMMADVSEISQIETGINRDGGYAAVFSLAMRLAISLGLILSGFVLERVGFKTGLHQIQSENVVWRIAASTFVLGSVICAAALIAIKHYPINESFLCSFRSKTASLPQPTSFQE